MLDLAAAVALMMKRQGLAAAVDETAYDTLFRQASPVLPPYWCCPGSPPILAFRAAFDDAERNFKLRQRREIVKGRFQGGNLGYVRADELELFAAAFRKEGTLSAPEMELLRLLEQEGPMTVRLMKEYTGRLVKLVTPALHKLQEKFLVFEDQVDNEWDRSWYLFSAEFPSVSLTRYTRQEAIGQILLRFAALNVWFQPRMARSMYRFPAKAIEQAVQDLCARGQLAEAPLCGVPGYVRTADLPLLQGPGEVRPSVFALHRNDFLIKSQEPFLAGKYAGKEWDVLQYLLIDGRIQGAVLGKFHTGPFQVEDIALDPGVDSAGRKQEILEAVARVNDPDQSPVKRFMGEKA